MGQAVIEEHMGLVQAIALDYLNIPGVSFDEAASEGHQALIRAAKSFDPARGKFSPYLARAVRNALNSLFAKHLRMAKMFPKSLDDAPRRFDAGSEVGSLLEQVSDSKQDVRKEVRRRETQDVLEEVMRHLSPREQLVVQGLRRGMTLSEIGEGLGVSKQAVHKVSAAAMGSLREMLKQRGFGGIDSLGLLKSAKERAG